MSLLRCQFYFGNSEVFRKVNVLVFVWLVMALYSFPCMHVIDSDSNTVSLPVNYEGTEGAIFNDCIKQREECHA